MSVMITMAGIIRMPAPLYCPRRTTDHCSRPTAGCAGGRRLGSAEQGIARPLPCSTPALGPHYIYASHPRDTVHPLRPAIWTVIKHLANGGGRIYQTSHKSWASLRTKN